MRSYSLIEYFIKMDAKLVDKLAQSWKKIDLSAMSVGFYDNCIVWANHSIDYFLVVK